MDDVEFKSVGQSDDYNPVSNAQLAGIKRQDVKDEYAFTMFEQAKYLKKAENEGHSDENLSVLTGLSKTEIRLIRNIAAKFDFDIDKFKKYYRDNNLKSWTSTVRKIYPPGRANYIKAHDRAYKMVGKAVKQLSEDTDNEKYPYWIEKFTVLRDMLDKYLPKDTDLLDKTELKYYNCCGKGCNEHAINDGFALKQDGTYPPMMYPLCENCRKSKTPIDYFKVAKIYFIYATQVEDAYINIMNSLD